jgi:hypothetical protein
MDPSMSAAEAVASIISRCEGAELVHSLKAADRHFAETAFESALAGYLRSQPDLVGRWLTWSADQRWTPSAYVRGSETGWYDTGYRNVIRHTDEAEAVADFIHRMSAWLAARRVVEPTKQASEEVSREGTE